MKTDTKLNLKMKDSEYYTAVLHRYAGETRMFTTQALAVNWAQSRCGVGGQVVIGNGKVVAAGKNPAWSVYPAVVYYQA